MNIDHPIPGYRNITDGQFKAAVEEARGHVIVEFYRTSCSSCNMYSPTLLEFGEKVGTQAELLRLNSDSGGKEYMEKYNCTSAPTLAFFYDGKLITTVVGAMPMHYFVLQLKKVQEAFENAGIPTLKIV